MSSAPKLWAGRFSQETDALVHQFNASLSFDRRLWPYDIRGSLAHVKMLGDCGIISPSDAKTIADGLQSLAEDLAEGRAELPPDAEDVHMAVETLLTQRLGPVAGQAAHGTLAQRPGGDRRSLVCQGRHPCRTGAGKCTYNGPFSPTPNSTWTRCCPA